MKRSIDFHLSYSRYGEPRISVSIGRCKSKPVRCHGAFVQTLEQLAERAEKAAAAVEGKT
jgi:hypothetical protein